MAIAVVCPGCSTKLTLDDDRAGETVECPSCDTAMSIPVTVVSVSPPAGALPDSKKYCHECGEQIRKKARVCPECGVEQPRARDDEEGARYDPARENANGKKLAAGLCGIFLGGFGIHKFILGLNNAGIIMLLVSVVTCGTGYAIVHLIGLIEGILYLTKSDVEFNRIYIKGRKEWF